MRFLKLLRATMQRPKAGIPLLIVLLLLVLGLGATHGTPHRHRPRIRSGWTLETPSLELRLRERPYAFEVVERSTGLVLVDEQRTDVTVGQHTLLAVEAENVRRDGNALSADLRLHATRSRAHVRFTFTSPDALKVELSGEGATAVGEEFADQGEHYYGLWEYPFGGDLDNRGASAPMLGPTFKADVHHCTARAPFYATSGGYGIYVQSQAEGSYHLAVAGRTGFRFREAPLTYHVLYGPSFAAIQRQYAALSGPARVPPTWALDSIWWRDDAHEDLRPGVRNAQENVLDDARQLQALRIPASAVWIDRPYGKGFMGWGGFDFDQSFPDPAAMAKELDARGIRLMLWAANRYWQNPPEDLLVRGRSGAVLDLRNPAARAWMEAGLRRFSKIGVRGYKIDRGEEGDAPDTLQNQLSPAVAQTCAESLEADHGQDYFLLARNVFDTARRHTAVWSGDCVASFGGLRMSVRNALRCSAMGFPMWGSDTGGLLSPWANMKAVPPTKELFARWLEFSAYCPMMEVLIGPHRTPWRNYDAELLEITRQCAATHHDLIPYTRSFLYDARTSGMGVIRPLVFAYPDDHHLTDRADEYLYGSELLVAPVLSSTARPVLGRKLEFDPGYVPHVSLESSAREIYLPAGQWIDYSDRHRVYQGPRVIHRRPGLAAIPVFAHAGAIVPRGDVLKSNNDWTPSWRPSLRIEVFPAAEGRSSFDYYLGDETPSAAGTVRRIRCERRDGGIEVACEDLGHPGTFEVYCRGVRGVTRDGKPLTAGRDYTYDAGRSLLRVAFTGATTLEFRGAESLFRGEPRP